MKQQHPESLASNAKRVKTGCGDMHVAVTQFENKPFEVFITLGKSGRCKNCMLDWKRWGDCCPGDCAQGQT